MNTTIAEIIRSFSDKYTKTKFYFAPAIPAKKLKNALKSYAPELQEDQVFILLDTTLFGSGKDGLLLTEDTLFEKSSFSKPRKILIRDIHNITLEETEEEYLESMDIHINEPDFPRIADINVHDARQFAALISELKAALSGSGEAEVVVNEISRESRHALRNAQMEQARLVPGEGEKLRRYSFININHYFNDPLKVENTDAGLFSHPKIFVGYDKDEIYARAEGKDVMVNGEPLVGKRKLLDRDIITLGTDLKQVCYEFQANGVTAKQRRVEEEHALGVIRYQGSNKPNSAESNRFVIDPLGILLKEDGEERKIFWYEVREIVFTADYDFQYQATTNLGYAAGQGVAIGSQTANAFLESVRESDQTAVFPAPMYKVEIMAGKNSVCKIENVDQNACRMLDYGVELLGPMDVVKFKC